MKFLIGLILFIVAGFAVIIPVVLHQEHQWEQGCEAQGGHVKTIPRGALCLSSDGRVIE